MNRTIRTLAAVGAMLLSTASATSSAWAQDPGRSADPLPSVGTQAMTPADQEAVTRYWTVERMRRAVPMSHPLTESDGSSVRTPQATAPRAFPYPGGLWTGDGHVVPTTGRVFFTFQGMDYFCSASSVVSNNRSTVITAGHCVMTNGVWHTRWAFVPAYRDGRGPYDIWPARLLLTTPQWSTSSDANHDIGAAVLNELGGRRLVDVVGGQGIVFNQPRGQDMYAFGYPARAPYNGERLAYCSGTVFDAPERPQMLTMRCNMTEGASGGPWFLRFDEWSGLGYINSVNSLVNASQGVWRGPYFGASAQNLYNQAQNS